MKKSRQTLFNIFWVLLVGIDSAICSAVIGTACMVTIVGIPFGLRHYKYIPLVFAPAGKKVVTKFAAHPFMNTMWLIFGGLETFLIYIVLGALLCATVIGAPIGKQLFKIAEYNLAPFGAEVLGEDEYSSYGDTEHDLKLLSKRVIANPDQVVGADEAGNEATARQYYASKYKEYFFSIKDHNFRYTRLPMLLSLIPFVFLIFIYIMFHLPIYAMIIGVVIEDIIALAVMLMSRQFIANKRNAIFDFKMLEKVYPKGSPQASHREVRKATKGRGVAMTRMDDIYDSVFTVEQLEQLKKEEPTLKLKVVPQETIAELASVAETEQPQQESVTPTDEQQGNE